MARDALPEPGAPTSAADPGWSGLLGELVRLSGPVILARLGIMVMGLTDAIVVGRHSATELGYHALGWAPTSVVLTTAVGLLLGVQILTARHIGEGRPEQTGGVLRRGLIYSFWLGLAATAILYFGGPSLMVLLRLEPDLAEGSGRVLQVFALSLTPYLLSVAGTFFLEAHSRPVPGMVAMWVANAVNLTLLLLLVPGRFGVGGAEAAGWATFGARSMLAVAVLGYIALMPDARRLGVFRKPSDGPEAAVAQRRLGYASGASYFVETAAFAAMNVIAGWLGALQVAAWAVVLNVAAVIFMAPLGLATATAVLVGRAYGARDGRGVVRSGVLGFAVCTVLMLAVCAVVFFAAQPIASAYTSEAPVIAMAVSALILSCLFYLADGLQVVASNALRAQNDVWLPTVTHTISYVAVMIPLAWFLALPAGLGLNGVVWAVVAASLLAAGFLLTRFAWLARRPAAPA
jgi:MATE family multidrug resistance protein